jgi:hypothetical protein
MKHYKLQTIVSFSLLEFYFFLNVTLLKMGEHVVEWLYSMCSLRNLGDRTLLCFTLFLRLPWCSWASQQQREKSLMKHKLQMDMVEVWKSYNHTWTAREGNEIWLCAWEKNKFFLNLDPWWCHFNIIPVLGSPFSFIHLFIQSVTKTLIINIGVYYVLSVIVTRQRQRQRTCLID